MLSSERSYRWPSAVSLFLVVLLLVTYLAPFADLDWSWQIRTGEQIVRTGSLRVTDAFTYTIHGTPLHDFEWLYEVVLYFTWSGFGIGGLKLLKVLVVAAPLVILALRLRAEKVATHVILLCLVLAVLVLTPAWNLRPLYITTIGLLLVSWWLHDHCTGRRRLTWWLIPTMLLWTNMHPGVITGQGLLLGAIAWEWLNRWLKWNAPLDASALGRLTLIGGLGFLVTFVCPDPIERLRYTFKPELSDPIMRIFVEMKPLFYFLDTLPQVVILLYAVAILTLWTVFRRFRFYRGWELALLAGTALLGNVACRSAMDWLLIMLALAVPHLKEMFRARLAIPSARHQPWGKALVRLDCRLKRLFAAPMFRWQPFYPAAVAALLVLASLIPPIARSMPIQNNLEWPVAALDFVERAGLQGRFFGPPDHGAYVGWRLRQRGLCYTDTRGFFFPPTLLEDSHSVPRLGPDWHRRLGRILDDFATDYFLLETGGERGALWNLLRPHVQPIYLDERTVLLEAAQVRRGLEAEKTRHVDGRDWPTGQSRDR